MPSISWEHMNDGDSFVLDLQHAVYVWVGKNSNRGERLKVSFVLTNLSWNKISKAQTMNALVKLTS